MKAEVRVTLHNGESHYFGDTYLTFAGERIWVSDGSNWGQREVRMVLVFPVSGQ